MNHKRWSAFSLLFMLGILSGQSLLLVGCSTLSSSSVAAGDSCPLTYGEAGQQACATHSCPMHDPSQAQQANAECTCDHQAEAKAKEGLGAGG